MIGYAVTMLLTAGIFGIVAVLICKGKTELIHDYHRQQVTDPTAYGKAFGKALGLLPLGMVLSGTIALLGERLMWLAVTMLFAGILAGIIGLSRVQKKYNGGVFS